MKKIRFLSAVMAACLSLSMFAGAVDTSASEEVIHTGTAVVVDADGNATETPFEFTAPADATAEEIASLSQLTAYSVTHDGVMPRASQQSLASKMHVDIPKVGSSAYTITCNRLTMDASEICVYMNAVIDCTKVNVSYANNNHPRETVYTTKNITSGNNYVYFYEGQTAGNGTIYMDEGDRITLGFSCNTTKDSGYANMIMVTAFA